MVNRRPSFARRWWIPLVLVAVALTLVAAKLSVRSVATGEAVLPGIAGAPVLGPQATATTTPGPGRARLRVQVLDPQGTPVPQAVVEVRDRFNAMAGVQETGNGGEAVLSVAPGPDYAVTVRKPGFSPGRLDSFDVQRPPDAPAAAAAAAGGGRAPAQVVQVRVEPSRLASAVTPARLFVGHSREPRLSLIDPTSNLLLKHSEQLGQGRLTLVASAPDSSRVYAAWSGSSEVAVLNGSDLSVERQLSLPGAGAISSLGVNPRTGRLWVATFAPETTDTGGMLHEVETAGFQVVRRIGISQLAAGLRFRPDGSLLYVRHRSANALSLVDANAGSVVTTVRLPQWPTDMSLSADGRTLYLVFLGSERLLEVDALSGETGRTIDVGSGASSVAAHPDGERIFVVNQLLGSVQVVDIVARQVVDLIPVGRSPQGAVLTASGQGLYVANSGSGTVSVVDPNLRTVRDTLNTGGSPSSLLLIDRPL